MVTWKRRPNLTKHARVRYAERCPDGPGLIEELATARRPSKKQWQRIRIAVCKSRSYAAYHGAGWMRRVWLSQRKTVIITAEREDGHMSVVTCWPLPEPRQKAA